MTLLTDEIRAMVGQSVSYTAPEPLGRASIRYFARAVGDDNPLYTDPGFARAHGYGDVVAPPTLVCETNQYMPAVRDEHGFPGHVWDVPVPGRTRLIRGGNSYTFDRPVGPDDVVTATFTLVDATERQSSAGKAMLVVTNEITYTDQQGQRLATNRETLIWQEL
jgi:acyl dehydratase